MAHITIGEKRFREGSGVQFLQDGVTIRCQAVSKTKLRAARERDGDFTSPGDKWWPELQCRAAAVPGNFTCRFHGGASPRPSNPRTIMDVLPLVLAEKFKVLQDNPDYINRKEDIILLKAMQWELLEELQVEAGNEEAWGMVHEAYTQLKLGNVVPAQALLFNALEKTDRAKDIRKEIRDNAKILSELTTTQTKTAKELRLMATTEQVSALFAEVQKAFFDAIKLVKDEDVRTQLGALFLGRLVRFNNLGITSVPYQLSGGTEPKG